jgi:hypothetical protein
MSTLLGTQYFLKLTFAAVVYLALDVLIYHEGLEQFSRVSRQQSECSAKRPNVKKHPLILVKTTLSIPY